jgi:hypothetical protein
MLQNCTKLGLNTKWNKKKTFNPFVCSWIFNDIKKKMECKIVGCKTKVMGLTWASDFIRPLHIKAGHASPQCSKTFLISKKCKIGPHNSVTTSLKIRFTISSLQLDPCNHMELWLFCLECQLAGHFKSPTNFVGISVASHTGPSNTTLRSLWTWSNKAQVMGSNLHVKQQDKYIYNVL